MSIQFRPLYQIPTQPWPLFHAVDDRVRGGASTSHWKLDHNLARFSGHLDIKTLGGAGFASQCTVYDPPLNLLAPSSNTTNHRATALVLRLSNLNPKSPDNEKNDSPSSFVLTLKNVRPADRTDGRKESVLNFEYHWDMKSQPNTDTVEVTAPWQDFVPTFRGREDKTSGIKLDPAHITELSFMCRSGFGAQSGDFSLGVESLSVQLEPVPERRIVGRLFARVQSFCEGITGWIRALWRREDRGVRLA